MISASNEGGGGSSCSSGHKTFCINGVVTGGVRFKILNIQILSRITACGIDGTPTLKHQRRGDTRATCLGRAMHAAWWVMNSTYPHPALYTPAPWMLFLTTSTVCTPDEGQERYGDPGS